MDKLQTINTQNLQDKIYTIRGLQVMLDRDLAELYQVETKNLNRAVNRNMERFPQSFRFQLTEDEYQNSLRFQIGTLESGRGKHRKYLTYVFTEQGVSMLSAVLRSDIAIKVSIQIIEAFVEMRKVISSNSLLFSKMEALEKRQMSYELKTDSKIEQVLNALEDKTKKPTEGIFYDGQIYDAYVFVNNL